jgi:ankyrin repeat protein
MEFGCDVRIADSNGRTPMHSACWAAHSNFDMVELLMQADFNLFFISDASGKLPLSYVKMDREPAWLNFLMSKMDQYWPTCDGMETESKKSDDGAAASLPPPPPSITSQQPGTRPLVDPTYALPIQLASMVADGRIEPDEAEFLKYDSVESQDSDWDSDGTCGSNIMGMKASYESIRSFNEASLADLLGNLDFSSEQVDWDY